VEIKCQLDATDGFFIADLIVCSTCFGHHYAHHQELKSIIQWLLPVVFRAVFFRLSVWCRAVGCVSSLRDAAAYFLLNMFRAPLCPSSGAQDYYIVVAACGIWCCGLCVRFAGCCSILQTGHTTHSYTPYRQLENHSTKYHRQQPLYNTLELLTMGIMVPETC